MKKNITIKSAVMGITTFILLVFLSGVSLAKTNTVVNSGAKNVTSKNIIANNQVANSLNNITPETVLATNGTVDENVNALLENFKENGATKTNIAEAIDMYREISKDHSNQEIAEIIKNSKVYAESPESITSNLDKINTVLENSNTEQVNTVLNKLNIENTLAKLQSGATVLDIMQEATKDMSTADKANLVFSILWATRAFQIVFVIAAVLNIYKILIRCVIYKKAKKHAWASFIPVYRDVVMLKICKMSPWWLLLALIPIVGWAFLWVVFVASRFMLAETFGKGNGFAFGLWFLPTIFESILTFSKKTKYIEIE